jgi:hypothetical protein
MSGWAVLLILVNLVAFGALCADMAEKKGYSAKVHFWIGFVFNVIGLIYEAGLPETPEKTREKLSVLSEIMNEQGTKAPGVIPSVHTSPADPSEAMKRETFSNEMQPIPRKTVGKTSENAGMSVTPTPVAPDLIACPLCGTQQRAGRLLCFYCSAKFIDENNS